MRKILLIGENSYIGDAFRVFAKSRYDVVTVSSIGDAWREADFTGYDSVLHCAGIAHVKQTKEMEPLYYEVNCDLAVDVANKAKAEKVKQFIFLSSMAVYGTAVAEIDEGTAPAPNKGDFYGKSKLKAEQELQKLADDDFRLCIVRPPMVYGQGCRGNFPRLVKLAKRVPVFPDYPNRRSMIYIDNLCDFLCALIDDEADGVFLPQNQEYVSTSELVRLVAEYHGRRVILTRLFNPVLRLLVKRVSVFEKLFGDLYYAGQRDRNGLVGFRDSVKRSC
jgi:UDP-glucose 4-epimerase